VDTLYGEDDHADRNEAMSRMQRGHAMLLLTTDMMSRGMDMQRLTHVFNFHCPLGPHMYLHRAGRIARHKPQVLQGRNLEALEQWADSVLSGDTVQDAPAFVAQSKESSAASAGSETEADTVAGADSVDSNIDTAGAVSTETVSMVPGDEAERRTALLDKIRKAQAVIDQKRGNNAVITLVFPNELPLLQQVAAQLRLDLQAVRLEHGQLIVRAAT